jgi:hypothetical protein
VFGNPVSHLRRACFLVHLSLCDVSPGERRPDGRMADIRSRAGGDSIGSPANLSVFAGSRPSVLRYLRQPALLRKRDQTIDHRYHHGFIGQSDSVSADFGGLAGT